MALTHNQAVDTAPDRRSPWGRIAASRAYRGVTHVLLSSPRRQFWLLAIPPILWVLTQHLGPMLQMIYVSFVDAFPVAPGTQNSVTLANYDRFFSEPIFWMPFFRTLGFSIGLTAVTLVLTYPVAYFLARHVGRRNQLGLLLVLLIPFWVGEIVRTYAIMILLGNNGAVNLALRWLGFIDLPIPFMYTGFSVSIGIIYLTSLYMMLPLYSALEKLPKSYTEAAADLGAGPFTRFFRVTLPLSLEGVTSGCTLVFLISTGYYATPVLLGGPSSTLFAETIAGFFHTAGDEWPTGAAFALLMFLAALLVSGLFNRLMVFLQKRGRT